ncbi:MAG: hypothetical protein GY865_16345 [candidate division Zixibacteria bacterium]|nr:hypothetical protein [candidate division Zixibacteria bacterium]
MKKIILLSLGLLVLVALVGCEERDVIRYADVDPAVPQGVYSITADEAIYIYWLPVQDNDLDYYRIWYSSSADGVYEYIGSSSDESYIDNDVDNGVTYYYAVSAVDLAGNESELSYETIFDTPRPESYDQDLYDANNFAANSGFDLSVGAVVANNSISADFYIDYDTDLDAFFINVADVDTDIQDMGYTVDFDEIGYAPADGWSYVGWVEVIVGHTYIIWTNNDHFAKIRVTDADYNDFEYITFDWAYQTSVTDPGRMELSRPQHDENYLKHDVKTKEIEIIR